MRYGVLVAVVVAACGGGDDGGSPRRVAAPPVDAAAPVDAAPLPRAAFVPAVRGPIRDRRGESLVANRLGRNVHVTPASFDDALRAALIQLLDLDADGAARIDARIDAGRREPRTPVRAVEDLTADQATRVHAAALPGVTVEGEPARDYPHGQLAAHVVGYMTPMNEAEVERLRPLGYRPDDRVGRYGLEAEWENYLRGKPGGLGADPEPGHLLITTLDAGLQRLAEAAVAAYPAAAIVVVEIATGELRAIVSTPSFDPAVMTRGPSRAELHLLDTDPRKPFLDKAVRARWAPGATFGFVPAIAAREDGVKVAEVSLDRIAEVARSFGFGARTGLTGDEPGRIPTVAWYEQRGPFRPQYTEQAAAGQGDVEATVLQVAMAYAALASGTLQTPQLVTRLEQPNGQVVISYAPQIRETLAIEGAIVDAIRGDLPTWRGQPALAGVAATAAVRARKGTRQAAVGGWDPTRPHAWFAGYAPADAPEVAIAVLLPHGGEADHAAAVARAVIDGWWTVARGP